MSERRISRDEAAINWRQLWMLVGIGIGIVVLWDTAILYPLKLLVVFFHELSHGLAAYLTGGRIVEIQIVPQQGGLCITAGGSRFVTLSAGYLGSLIWGGVILVVAARTHADKAVSVSLGLLLILVSVVWIRPMMGFGFVFGVACGIGLAGVGAMLPREANDFLLKVIGLTNCLYAVLDIKSDIMDRPGLESDAVMLAELTGIPGRIWGAGWILVAVIAAFYFLTMACTEDGKRGRDVMPTLPPVH